VRTEGEKKSLICKLRLYREPSERLDTLKSLGRVSEGDVLPSEHLTFRPSANPF
jgi:hypothetical protein